MSVSTIMNTCQTFIPIQQISDHGSKKVSFLASNVVINKVLQFFSLKELALSAHISTPFRREVTRVVETRMNQCRLATFKEMIQFAQFTEKGDQIKNFQNLSIYLNHLKEIDFSDEDFNQIPYYLVNL